MKRKNRIAILFALVLLLLVPDIAAEARTKPKLEVKKKTTSVGRKCQLKLNGVSDKAKALFWMFRICHIWFICMMPLRKSMCSCLVSGIITTGKIDTVVTKDLSRLGRNYIDSGTYIERIFPLFHVRYIAVNDDFDTDRKGTDITMPLKNIINEWYARDISAKIRASQRTMWKNGEYACGRPPYGYKKDAVAKKLVVDGKTAPNVKRVFEMYLNGMTYSEIARKLQKEGIVSPPKYRYLEQGNDGKAQTARDWYHLHIKTILANRHYVGDSVHATREGGFNNPNKDRRVSEENWIIISNTHEPLISRELFEEVQKKIKMRVQNLHAHNAALKHEKTPENFFPGKCICACCRKNIGVVRSNTGSNYFYYRCTTTMFNHHMKCAAHGRMKYRELHDVVFQVIKSHGMAAKGNT